MENISLVFKTHQMRNLILLVFAIMAFTVSSQSLKLEKHWWQPSGTVYSMMIDSLSKTVYVGGSFGFVGPDEPYGAEIDKTTGLPDLSIPNPNAAVTATLSDGKGGWFIGGGFTQVGDSLRTGLAHIDSSGQVTNLFRNEGVDGVVNSFALKNDTLYIGGAFRNQGNFRYGAAVYDTNSNEPDYSHAEPPALNFGPQSKLFGNVDIAIPDDFGGWYVGGSFETYGDSIRYSLAHLDSMGQVTDWNPMATSATGYTGVRAMVKKGNTLFLAGSFESLGGKKRNSLAAIDLVTNQVTSWNPNPNNSVNHMQLIDSTLYIAGNFDTIGGLARNELAAVSTSTGFIDPWNPLENWTNNFFMDIHASQNKIFIAGSFQNPSGAQMKLLVVNRFSGQLINWNFGFNDDIRTLEGSGDTLFVGGRFRKVSGVAKDGFAAFKISSGTLLPMTFPVQGGDVWEIKKINNTLYFGGIFGWQYSNEKFAYAMDIPSGVLKSWNPRILNIPKFFGHDNKLFVSAFKFGSHKRCGLLAFNVSTNTLLPWKADVDYQVDCLMVIDSLLYVGGYYSSIGNVSRNSLARVNRKNGNVSSWNPDVVGPIGIGIPIINDFVRHGNLIFVGGYFDSIAGQLHHDLGAINISTALPNSWNLNTSYSNPGFSSSRGSVYTLAISGNELLVGGLFDSISGVYRKKLAGVELSTGNVTSWAPIPDRQVWDIEVSDSTIYIAGDFLNIGGNARQKLASFDQNGNLLNWNPHPFRAIGSSASGIVGTLSSFNEKIYIGGSFTSVGGVKRNNLVALDIATGQPTSWNPDVNDDVTTIDVTDSLVLVGGDFSNVNGQTRSKLAAISKATGTANSWNPKLGPSFISGNTNYVNSLDEYNGVVYVGGRFDSVNGIFRKNIAAIDLQTGIPTTWNPKANYSIFEVTVHNGYVYSSGQFDTIGGKYCRGLAQLSLSTGNATAWNANLDQYGRVYTIKIEGNRMYIGGWFSSVSGQPRSAVAAIDVQTANVLAWNPSIGSKINGIDISDSTVYVGGSFYLNSVKTRAASIDKSTGNINSWNSDFRSIYSSEIHSVLASDSLVYFGGKFSGVGENTRSGLAVFSPCQSSYSTDVKSACNSYKWIDGKMYYSSDSTAQIALKTANGCDSIVTLNLKIDGDQETVESQTACGSFTWINGQTYTASTTGALWTGVNQNGCDSIVRLSLKIYPENMSIAVSDTTITIQNTAGTYQWLDCNNGMSPILGETGQSLIVKANGSYAVQVTQNGCVDTSDCLGFYSIGLSENTNDLRVNVYPNPNLGSFTIELNEKQERIEVKVYTLSGVLVSKKLFKDSSNTLIELNVESGLYLLEVTNHEGARTTRKILIN